jgi:hypothetical protein
MSIRFSDCTFPTEETRSSCILSEKSGEFGKDADTSGNKFLSISNEVINEPNKITNKKRMKKNGVGKRGEIHQHDVLFCNIKSWSYGSTSEKRYNRRAI